MRFRFLAGLVAVLFGVITVIGVNSNRATALPRSIHQPTSAPTPTPGMPIRTNPTNLPRARPLTTEELALEQTLKIDANIATWEQPWSLATLQQEPGRITIQSFPDLTSEAEASEGFSPEIVAATGAVWRITIVCAVQLNLPGSSNAKFDGVTYVISQRLEDFLAVRSGKPLSSTTP